MKTLSLFALLCIACSGLHAQLKKVTVNNAELHYTDTGSGDVILFVHGALEDYQVWTPTVNAITAEAPNYRVITYSRRYNYPNKNAASLPDFSPATEAADLAAFIRELKLKNVHLVGHSFGGTIALTTALKYPSLLKSVTLSEPGLIYWLKNTSEGVPYFDKFENELSAPLRKAFGNNDIDAVLKTTLSYFGYTGELSDELRTMFDTNMREWKAIFYDGDKVLSYEFRKEDVKQLKMPVLIVNGEKSLPMFHIITKELAQTIPHAKRVTMDTTHDVWIEKPAESQRKLIEFLKVNH